MTRENATDPRRVAILTGSWALELAVLNGP